MLPAKTVDTWESSAGIGKQEESGRIEVGEESGEEHRICPECLSGGIHSALFLLPPPEKGECPRSTRGIASGGQDSKDGCAEVINVFEGVMTLRI